ncbi:hypothetical protein B0H15DRAFT_986058 [Mycena belliarum]|uniref:Uncharacterized protein n=1 Tax=Mycena belliarum TaxID=1033014 RepID=A0AAD6U6Z0_9AGAR|nr:hypothetical protein B0H15DRAFT_986058 [Mycena belliae]
MADVQAHTARLIALFVSCVLYGMLLTTFVPCIHSLLFSASQRFRLKPCSDIKFPILIATILMFLVATFSAVISMQNIIDAFIHYSGPGGALEYYRVHNKGWKHWVVAIGDAVQVVVGDALLIYRCYVIHDRNWRSIIMPAVSWIAMAALSVMSLYRELRLQGSQRLDDRDMMPLLASTLLLTFATSLITTYLIVRRLLKAEFRPDLRGRLPPHFLVRVGKIFFETGLFYTLSVVASLVVYLSASNLSYVASLAIIHIIPLTCNLLLIRVESINCRKQILPSHRKEEEFNPNTAEEV